MATGQKPPVMKKRVTFVNNQYNSPLDLYSEAEVANTLSRHTQLLANGAVGIDFGSLSTAPNNLRQSKVYKMLTEDQQQQHQAYQAWHLHQQQQQQQQQQQTIVTTSSTTTEMKRVAWPPQSAIATTRSFDLTEPANEITTYQQQQQRKSSDGAMAGIQQQQQEEEQFKATYQQTNYQQQFSDGGIQQELLQKQQQEEFKEVTAIPVRLETPEPVYEPVQLMPVPVQHMPEPVQLMNDEINDLPLQQQQEQQVNAVPIKIPPPVPPKPILRRDTSRDATSEQGSIASAGGIVARRDSSSSSSQPTVTAVAPIEKTENETAAAPSVMPSSSTSSNVVPDPFASNELIGERSLIAKPAPPPGLVLGQRGRTLKKKPLPYSPDAAVHRSEPLFRGIRGTTPVRMLGDLVWPPKGAFGESERSKTPVQSPGPVRRQVKNYRDFFAQNQLPQTFPTYRAPPGTQHFGLEEGENATPM